LRPSLTGLSNDFSLAQDMQKFAYLYSATTPLLIIKVDLYLEISS